MDMSNWPQWLVMFGLITPVILWPMARLVGVTWLHKQRNPHLEWLGGYIGLVIGKVIAAFVLYSGGFWS